MMEAGTDDGKAEEVDMLIFVSRGHPHRLSMVSRNADAKRSVSKSRDQRWHKETNDISRAKTKKNRWMSTKPSIRHY